MTVRAKQIQYINDGQNRRIGKEVNGTLTEGFLYDGQLEPVAELDGSGNVVEQFVYGTRPNVPDYIIKGGVEYRVISDQIGSPVLIVNATTGAIAEQISYDAWGNVTSDSNPGFQPFGFAGGLYDTDTGLVHFGARDYDPQTGRWISKDPVLFNAGETSLYGYAANDPINFIDPTGLLHIPFTHIWVPAGETFGAESAQYWADQFVKNSGPEAWFDYGMGLFASLWTPCTSDATLSTLLAAEGAGRYSSRPFWRYVGPESDPASPWLTRGIGWKPPFGEDMVGARNSLQLPHMPTNVTPVSVPWYEPVIGPRIVGGNPAWGYGGGLEYARGGFWP